GNDQRAFAARGRRVVVVIKLNGREPDNQAAVYVHSTAPQAFLVVGAADQAMRFDQLAQEVVNPWPAHHRASIGRPIFSATTLSIVGRKPWRLASMRAAHGSSRQRC